MTAEEKEAIRSLSRMDSGYTIEPVEKLHPDYTGDYCIAVVFSLEDGKVIRWTSNCM
jgi:hypothetical protein